MVAKSTVHYPFHAKAQHFQNIPTTNILLEVCKYSDSSGDFIDTKTEPLGAVMYSVANGQYC
jgi:hypothetical protein